MKAAQIMPGLDTLWDAIADISVPLTLARGALSPVVDDEDVAELQRRKPDARVVVFEGAGHSIQGDQPVELAGAPAITRSTGRPAARHAWKPPMTSVARCSPRSCSRAAARLEQ